MNIFEFIRTSADTMSDDLVRIRRDFHKYAEPGWLEMRTTTRIARELISLGYEVLLGDAVCRPESRMGVPDADVLEAAYLRAAEQGADAKLLEATRGGKTGVIGILRCGDGPTAALRFDIDALGVIESDAAEHLPAKEGFASVNTGAMHACGHDGHAAIGIGTARILMQLREHLHGTVKLIFQPAEEGVRGAKAIVDAGHLDDADYFLCAHITGKSIHNPAVVTPGAFGSLATTKYDVVFHGKAAHAGGAPHAGNNAILAASAAVLNLYAIPRHADGATRINVGTLHAGSGRNVIADEAKMELEVRGETTELNRYMSDCAVRVIEAAAAMYGCTAEFSLMGAADSLSSDADLCQRIAAVCTDGLNLPVSDVLITKNSGSEDASYMMNRVQEHGGKAAYMRALTPCKGIAHGRMYDFDEAVLANQVEVFCGTVYDLLK